MLNNTIIDPYNASLLLLYQRNHILAKCEGNPTTFDEFEKGHPEDGIKLGKNEGPTFA